MFFFETVLTQFNQDALFQIQRVAFPLRVKYVHTIEFELHDRIFEEEGYYLKIFEFTKVQSTEVFKEHKQTITILEDRALIEIEGIGNRLVVFILSLLSWKGNKCLSIVQIHLKKNSSHHF